MSHPFVHTCSVSKINVTYLYSLSCSNVTSAGMLGRIERQGFDPQTAFIMATTEDMLSWMEDYPKVDVRIVEITKDAIAFQCHPDKLNLAVNHSLTYYFEWLFGSMFNVAKIPQRFMPLWNKTLLEIMRTKRMSTVD